MDAARQAPPAKHSHIIIVGAGVFGLSTAIHLAQRGYSSITVFDKQPYHQSKYAYDKGCDAASADANKIIRSAYGKQSEYQQMSSEALVAWEEWNEQVQSGQALPDGMTTADKVFVNNGNLSLTDKRSLPQFELDSIETAKSQGLRETMLTTNVASDALEAEKRGLGFAIDPFKRRQKSKPFLGLLDTTGGIAVADKACLFALHKAQTLGVRFVPGKEGTFASLCHAASSAGEITGIRTQDGVFHPAALTILACGGWTPSIVPALDRLCETTADSVAFVRIPRESPLFERFAPANFPSWVPKMRDGADGGLYGFPCDGRGVMKLGYRGTKYTNPVVQADGKERSVPATRWTDVKLTKIPRRAMDCIQGFVDEFLPELEQEGIKISSTRLCWYTDSFDTHFVVDYVPKEKGLMVATGGGGHAFKYLPILGKYVADVVENVGIDRPPVCQWLWRTLRQGETPVNVLMEGKKGARALCNVELVDENGAGRCYSRL